MSLPSTGHLSTMVVPSMTSPPHERQERGDGGVGGPDPHLWVLCNVPPDGGRHRPHNACVDAGSLVYDPATASCRARHFSNDPLPLARAARAPCLPLPTRMASSVILRMSSAEQAPRFLPLFLLPCPDRVPVLHHPALPVERRRWTMMSPSSMMWVSGHMYPSLSMDSFGGRSQSLPQRWTLPLSRQTHAASPGHIQILHASVHVVCLGLMRTSWHSLARARMARARAAYLGHTGRALQPCPWWKRCMPPWSTTPPPASP